MKNLTRAFTVLTCGLYLTFGAPARAASPALLMVAREGPRPGTRLEASAEYGAALKAFGNNLILALVHTSILGPRMIDASIDEPLFRALSDVNHLATEICGTDHDCAVAVERDLVAKIEAAWQLTSTFNEENRSSMAAQLVALSARSASPEFLAAHVRVCNEASARAAGEFNRLHNVVFGGFAVASVCAFIAATYLEWTPGTWLALSAGAATLLGHRYLRHPPPVPREVEATRNYVGPAFVACAEALVQPSAL